MRISIHFNLVKGGSTSEDLPIRMRISYDGLRLDVRSGFVCHPDKWDDEHERMRPGTTNRYGEKASTINNALSKMECAINDILARYEIDGVTPEPKTLKEDFEITMGKRQRHEAPKPSNTFKAVFGRYLSECSVANAWSTNTQKVYYSTYTRLCGFEFFDKQVDDLTESDLSSMVSQLWHDGCENTSVANFIVRVRACLRWAHDTAKVYHGDLHTTFKQKLKGTAPGSKDVKYLEWSEFLALYNLNLLIPAHIVVRDAFCFCCATGLRDSDCQELRWSNVNLEASEISIVVKKTKIPVVIQLNKYSLEIISKYLEQAPDRQPNDLVFPQHLNWYSNRVLPVIAKMANLDRQVRNISYVGNRCTETYKPLHDCISTHYGRHTFIVQALRLGIEPTVIMSWTGHSTYDTMRPYIAIVQETKVAKMALFDK